MKTTSAFRAAIAAIMGLSLDASMLGQAIIGGGPANTTSASGHPSPSANEKKASPAEITSALGGARPLAQWGPVAFRPHLSYTFTYGDGFLRVPGQPTNTYLQAYSPGLLLEAGSHATFDYTWTRTSYSSRLLSGTSDHNASAHGSFSGERWDVYASHAFGSNSPTLVETGTQTHEKTQASMLGLTYRLGKRGKLENELTRSARQADPLIKSITWTGSDWTQWRASSTFRYELSNKFYTGVGIAAGLDEISGDTDMRYTQPLLSIGWLPTEKISFHVRGGVERRKSVASGARASSNVLYDGVIRYSPLPTTSLALSRNATVSTSYFSNQSTKNDGWEANLYQRFIGKAYITAGYSRGRVTYVLNSNFVSSGRDDRFHAVSLGIGCPLLHRGSVSFSYTESVNDSTTAQFGFTTHQFSFQASFQF